MPRAICEDCGSLVEAELTYNGICTVGHYVHCGWGHQLSPDDLISDDAAQIIAKLEAKLAKAVEALGLADDALYEAEAILGGEYGDHYGPLCEMMVKLRAKIAEIKSGVATTPYGLEGESHE